MPSYKAPFIFKMSFYLPDHPANPKKNSAHIRYIGTRPGVDRGMEIDPYQQMTISDLEPGSAAHHIKYAHERPRSHGLFSSGDEEINMTDVQNELLDHKGIVWRLIISLEGSDAERLDMLNRSDWEEAIKTQMPDMVSKMGIQESNLSWVAAYHPEVGHPHAHIVFWEKKPKRRRGVVTERVKNEMKKVYIKKIYAADRDRFGKEKTAMRDKMREIGVDNLRGAVAFMRNWKGQMKEAETLHNLAGSVDKEILPPRVDRDQNLFMVKSLEKISKLLPGHGRLMLKFMPDDVKAETLKLATWLYEQSQFNPVTSKYEKAAEMLARPYSNQEKQLQNSVEKAKSELVDRLSQIVLKAAFEIGKKNQFTIQPEKAILAAYHIKTASGKIENNLKERLARQILLKSISIGLSKEDYFNVIKKLSLPKMPLDKVDKYFTEAQNTVKKLTNDMMYFLKASLGGEEAKKLLLSKGYREEELKPFNRYSKVSLDNETLAKVFRIPDEQVKVVSQMTKVLLAAGMKFDEVVEVIGNWNKRSESLIPNEKIALVVKKTEKEFNELKDWGRTPIITKKDFKRLCGQLNIETPYPWRSNRELDFVKQGHHTSVVQGVFKHAMKQIVAQMKRSEAEREREQTRKFRSIKANADREADERERKDRGR